MSSIFHRPALADDLATRLIAPKPFDEGLRSGLFLSGQRRTGKTTFLMNDLIPALEALGAIVIYVDLWTDVTANPATLTYDAIKKTLKDLQTPASSLVKRVSSIKGLDVGALGFKFGFKLDSIGAQNGVTLAKALTTVVDQSKTSVVLIMDEVQQAITTDDGNKMLLAMKAARDAINTRPGTPGHFIFVGTGSHRALVGELTVRRNQAFAGATSNPYPVLGGEYVDYLMNRLSADPVAVLPSRAAAIEGFHLLGHRPEELQRAFRQMPSLAPTNANVDELFTAVVRTLRASAADIELTTLEGFGGLAEAVFDRITMGPGGKNLFSAAAATEYSRAIGRKVRVEEIQPVVKELVAANLIMRKGHGEYLVTDPFVQEMWLERKTMDAALRPPAA